MLSRVFLCLFPAIFTIVAVNAASGLLLKDEFNSILLERSSVAIEDHSDKYPWIFEGSKKNIRCKDGILSLGANPGAGQVQMFSKMKFKSGELKTRIRLAKTGKGIHFYIGFFQRNPWNYRSAWVMFNNSGNGHLYMTNGEHKLPGNMLQKIRTGELEAGRWYDLTVKLDDTGSELFIDGVSKGKLALPDVAPDQGMNLVFIVNPGGQGTALDVDFVTVSGEEDMNKKPVAAIKKVAIPVPRPVKASPVKIVGDQPASIKFDSKKLCLENGFYRYTFDTADGLLWREFFSKFLKRNVLLKPTRFFAIHHKNAELPNNSFKVTDVKITGGDRKKSAVISLLDRERSISGTIKMTVSAGSPELLVKPEFTNTGKEKNVFGVSCPLMGNMRIGDSAADDEYFFPMESGLAGSMDCDLRQVYGMTLFMQLMSVWDPLADGGVYAYTMDKTGYPKIMEVKHRGTADAAMSAYPVVPWSELDKTLFDNAPGTSLGWRHLDFELPPGGKTDIPAAVIGVNKGAWQAGLKSYSDFVKTWFKKPYSTPRWYTEMYCCLSAHPHSGLWMFSRSPSKGYYNKAAGEYSYGKSITHLEKNAMQEIAFWWDLPEKYDIPTEQLGKFGLPFINVHFEGDYEYHQRRGGLKALKDEIALVHSKESRIILYTMVRGAAKGTKAYELGRKWAQITAYGTPKTDYTGEGLGWNFCDMEQDFARYYSTLLAKRVAETDSDGYRLDVLCRVSPCYNPDHAHYNGTLRSTTNPVLLGETLQKFKGELYKVSPEKIVTVEHAGNDYISQFHDGYFAENISWISESPMWADFRKLNAYMTVFTRFYFPEVKTWIHGASNSDEAVRMSLFNACGFACTSYKGIRAFRTLEENSDTFDGRGEKLPHIPTPVDRVFANSFAPESGSKQIWTVFNRSGKRQTDLLTVDSVPGDHRYVEVYRDEKVSAVERGGKTAFVHPLPENEVAVIVRFEKLLKVSLDGGMLTAKVDAPEGMHCRVIFGEDDFMAEQKDLPFVNGEVKVPVPAGNSKIIVKLYRGKYLKDEIVIAR